MTGPVAPGPVVLPPALPGAPAPALLQLAEVLPVRPGQELAARVLAAAGGQVELAIAGRLMGARTEVPLVPGQEIRLVVEQAGAERVVLRLAVPPPPAGAPTSPGPAAPSAPPELPPAAARVLAAEAGPQPPPDLAARAAEAGVRTPAEAAGFARLVRAGLPTTPATVAGMALIIDGPPAGRALVQVAAATVPAASSPTAATPPAPPPAGPVPALPPAPAPAAAPAPPPPAAAGPDAPRPAVADLGQALARLVAHAAADAASGDPARLARALQSLGHGMEARLARGEAPAEPPARAILIALAAHPDADPAVARGAERLADALAAQPLAGPPPAPGAPAAAGGAYLQLPLPGGQTAEVRVDADADEGGGDGRPRRLAFLLHLSALGPVLVQATAGPAGVEATVRVQAPEARAFCAGRAGDLAEGLEHAAARARVRVEPLRGTPPAHLVDPPPHPGAVDQSA
ncbi:MAG: hypothetical protein MUE51_10925 [Thermoleophilia bacterium]|jgi:hypothetical protein|nr:hypothetical protein [Thermoleophilia bacterium]